MHCIKYYRRRGNSRGKRGLATLTLTWSHDCHSCLPSSVLCPFIPHAAGAGQPFLHVAAVGPAVLYGHVLDEEPVYARGRALQMQPPLQVVFGRLLSVVEGSLAAQAGHRLPLGMVGLPHEPLDHELGGRARAVQDDALQLHLLRLQNRQVSLDLAELQAAVWEGRERDISHEKTASHLHVPFPSTGEWVPFQCRKTAAPSTSRNIAAGRHPTFSQLPYHVSECLRYEEFSVIGTAVAQFITLQSRCFGRGQARPLVLGDVCG